MTVSNTTVPNTVNGHVITKQPVTLLYDPSNGNLETPCGNYISMWAGLDAQYPSVLYPGIHAQGPEVMHPHDLKMIVEAGISVHDLVLLRQHGLL